MWCYLWKFPFKIYKDYNKIILNFKDILKLYCNGRDINGPKNYHAHMSEIHLVDLKPHDGNSWGVREFHLCPTRSKRTPFGRIRIIKYFQIGIGNPQFRAKNIVNSVETLTGWNLCLRLRGTTFVSFESASYGCSHQVKNSTSLKEKYIMVVYHYKKHWYWHMMQTCLIWLYWLWIDYYVVSSYNKWLKW